MLGYFVAQIALNKTKTIKDMMPKMKKHLDDIRQVVKPIVAASQAGSQSSEEGSPPTLHTHLKALYVYQLQVVSISCL